MKRVFVLLICLTSLLLSACRMTSFQMDSVEEEDISYIEKSKDELQEQEPIDKEQWNLIFINNENPLPENYQLPELEELENGLMVDARIYNDLNRMLRDAKAEGLSPVICSAYRSEEEQEDLFNEEIRKGIASGKSQEEAMTAAAMCVTMPGCSEHHTGLAVDIVDIDYQILDEEQENTSTQRWLMKNAYKYGFILRYPKDKAKITGVHYEPWHYRYVGKEAAKEITKQGICFEEYLDEL